MAHGDHVTRAGEQVDLAEVDHLPVLVVVGGLQDDEDVVTVVLDLRPLVRILCVLDGQLMQPEEARKPVQVTGLGLMDADPDELTGAGGAAQVRSLLGGQQLLVLAHAVLVVGAVDDHRAAPRSGSVAPAGFLPLGEFRQPRSSPGIQATSMSTRLPLNGTPSARSRRRC